MPHVLPHVDGPIYGTPLTLALVEAEARGARHRRAAIAWCRSQPRDTVTVGELDDRVPARHAQHARTAWRSPSTRRSGRSSTPATSRSTRRRSTASTSTSTGSRSSARRACWRCSPTARTSSGPAFTGSELDVVDGLRGDLRQHAGQARRHGVRDEHLPDADPGRTWRREFGRKVAFVGRGMIENSQIAQRLGLPADPAGPADPRVGRAELPARGRSCASTTGQPGRAAGGALADRDRRPPPRQRRAGRHAWCSRRARSRATRRRSTAWSNHLARRGADVVTDGDQARARVRPRQRGGAEADAVARAAAVLRADPRRVPPAVALRAARRAASRRRCRGRRRCCSRRTATSCASTATAGAIVEQRRRPAACSSTARASARSATRCCAIGGTWPRTAWSCRCSRSTSRPAAIEGVPDVITRGPRPRAGRRGPRCARRAGSSPTCSSDDERRGAHRPRADQGEDPRRAAAVLPEARRAGGRWCCRSSWRSEPWLQVRPCPAASASSWAWRCSPLALIWLIALVTYDPSDPAWFFNTGATAPAGELHRPRRRVPRRAVVPAPRLRRVPDPGCCSASSAGTSSGAAHVDAVYTKLVGAALLFGCASALLHLRARRGRRRGRTLQAGRLRSATLLAARLAESLQPHRLDHRHPDAAAARRHPGHAVLVRALVLGRRPRASRARGAAACGRVRDWREARRQREAAPRGHRASTRRRTPAT